MYYRRSLFRNKADTRRIDGGIILDRYSIRMSTKAKNDYKKIIRYIKSNLHEPIIAEKYAILIKDRIDSLKYYPQKFEVASSVIVKQDNIRKLIINNYIVFYKIKEESKEVYILRIMYSGSDWIEKL